METAYHTVNVLTRWTFESTPIREWVEDRLEGRVLNACAGQSRLDHEGEVVRNDLDPEITADLHCDVAELPVHLESGSFDRIVYDPPWSHYQSNLRYDGRHVRKGGVTVDLDSLPFSVPRDKQQIGHARLAKDGFDYLLKDGGKVIQLTLHGTCMPQRLGYEREERVMFDPIGEAKTVIGSVDRKAQSTLG